MTALSHAERDHLQAFTATRPDWRTVALSERIFDEDDGSRVHKYPRSHPYITGMQYVMRHILSHGPCKVLDIGSPLTQNVALACMPGVEVTVLDVRPHDDAEMLGLTWKNGTATELPYPDASWDFVTSLWVMGHVGDARYGDALDYDGDRKMLAEVSRVLRPGGTAIIGPGLVDEEGGNIFNLHRIYSWRWLRQEFVRSGFEIIETRDLHVSDEWFIDKTGSEVEARRRDGHYGLALLRKL